MQNDFIGKTGLIIGGTSGIGRTVTKILLQRGAEHVIIVGRDTEKLQTAERELTSSGKVRMIHADITNRKERDRLLSEIDNTGTNLDLLVNSAGAFSRKPFSNIPPKTTIDILISTEVCFSSRSMWREL